MDQFARSHRPAVPEKSHTVFHLFPELPFELRRKIWMILLDPTPQIYKFKFRYPFRVSHNPWRNHLRTGDQIFLQPFNCSGTSGKTHPFQPLKTLMVTRFVASATCIEFRRIVLELYPDTLKFRHFPSNWMSDKSSNDRPDGTGFPEYLLRFNSTKDVVVLCTPWEDQEAAIEIAKLRCSPPDSFLKIRHVGISVDSLKMAYGSVRFLRWGIRHGRCRCTTEECQDFCNDEPLPKFLALFPSLQALYIAQVPYFSHNKPDDGYKDGNSSQGRANCPCPNDKLKHTWQMIKSHDTCGDFVVYNERSICPFPRLERVEAIRQKWRPHFPYYKALDHLEIKFIQPWDPTAFSSPAQCTSCKI